MTGRIAEMPNHLSRLLQCRHWAAKPGSLTKTWIGMIIHPGGALPLSSHGQAPGPHRILEEEYSGMNLFLKVEQSVPVCGKVLF